MALSMTSMIDKKGKVQCMKETNLAKKILVIIIIVISMQKINQIRIKIVKEIKNKIDLLSINNLRNEEKLK